MTDTPQPIDWIKNLEILHVEPGDVIVLQTDHILSAAGKEHLSNAVQTILEPKKVKVMVLEDGMKMGVLRPPKDAA